MRIRKLGAAILAAGSMIWCGTATAGGLGAYFEYGRNIATTGGDPLYDFLAQNGLADRNEIAFGLAYDSNVSTKRPNTAQA